MSAISRSVELGCWLLTGTLLALFPKCPACLAIYVAIGTGIGLSISMAWYLQTGLMILCVVSLAFLTLRLVRRRFRFLSGRERQVTPVHDCHCLKGVENSSESRVL